MSTRSEENGRKSKEGGSEGLMSFQKKEIMNIRRRKWSNSEMMR